MQRASRSSGSKPDEPRIIPACAGNLDDFPGGLLVVRLIPARAGKPTRSAYRRNASAAHPRAGGEILEPHFNIRPGDGSSPHVRRTHIIISYAAGLVRLIPARAENPPIETRHLKLTISKTGADLIRGRAGDQGYGWLSAGESGSPYAENGGVLTKPAPTDPGAVDKPCLR